MKVFFKSSFIKDFQNLPGGIKEELRTVCLSTFPKIQNVREFKGYPLKKLRGFRFYYRIKMKNFRVGLKKEGKNKVIFMRVLPRKDIYKYFP